MADERTKTLIGQALAGEPSTRQIVEGLFETNGYDGHRANRDWHVMNEAADVNRIIHWGKYAYFGIFGFSAYHCTRLASLSPSGRLLAPVGAAAGLFLLSASFGVRSGLRSIVNPEPVAEKAAE